MESPPPLCGAVADTERVGANRTIAANAAIADAAIPRRVDCMCSLPLIGVGPKRTLYVGRSLLNCSTGGNGMEIRFASFRIRLSAGRDRLGRWRVRCGQKILRSRKSFDR